MKFFCALIVFVAVVSTVSAGKRRRCFPVDDTPDEQPGLRCGRNERYEKCTTLCGEKTCRSREDFYCGIGCEEKCLCKEGYIRDDNKDCILVEDCPAVDPPGPLTCGEHEFYDNCTTVCGETTCKGDGFHCGVGCNEKCLCEEGYVRNDDDWKCILVEDCPADQPGLTCGDHEVYEKCSTLCGEATCDRRTPLYCGVGCEEKCLCEEGYIRDANDRCILEEDCPADQPGLTCGEHEVYEKCSTLCGEATCDRRTPLYCGVGCEEKCLCEEGYIRDANDRCILEEDCPAPTCDKAHESYTTCGTACPVTCDNKNDEIICTRQCVQGCFCDAGYVRDCNGECILPEECPETLPRCGVNEEYSACGANACQNTCSNPTLSMVCRAMCIPGCVCHDGFLRDDDTGDCVAPFQCNEKPW